MNAVSMAYKVTADRCRIEADVYPVVGGERPHPVILWIHGGSLISGSRKSFAGTRPDQIDRYAREGFVVVAIDYRLAPEVKIPAIMEDISDAHTWVRVEAAQRFDADPDRIALVGASAGGYLSLMGGFHLSPRPRAIVSFFGYGDIAGDWATKPFYYSKEPSLSIEEEARLSGGAAVSSNEGLGKNRSRLARFYREEGTWAEKISGLDPETRIDEYKPFCPYQNVTPEYPPTLFLHGDLDDNVPYQQAVMMAKRLDRCGVDNDLITIHGGPHGFYRRMPGDPQVEKAMDAVMAFLLKYIG